MPNNYNKISSENIDWIAHGAGHNCDEHSCSHIDYDSYQHEHKDNEQFTKKFGYGKINLFIPSHLERIYQSKSKKLFDTVINTFDNLAKFFPRNVQGSMNIDLSLCQTGDRGCTSALGVTSSQQSGNTYTTFIQIRHVSDWQQLLETLIHESDHAWRQQNYQKAATGTLCEGLASFTAEGPCSSEKINFSRNQRTVPYFNYIFDDNHGGDFIKLYRWGYFVAWYFSQTLNQNEFNKLVKLNAYQIANQYGNHYPAFTKFFNNIEEFCQQNPNIQLKDVIKWAEKKPSMQIMSRSGSVNSQNIIPNVKNTITINGHTLTAPFEIIVHGMDGCAGCGAAKDILNRHNIKFNYTTQQTTQQCNGKYYPYVPKIFINGLCLTGEELANLEQPGILAQLAKAQKFPNINSIPVNITTLSIKNRTVTGKEKVKIIGSAGGCNLCAQTKKILDQKNIKYTYYLQTQYDPTPGKCNEDLDVIPKVYFGEDIDSPCVSLSQLKQLDKEGVLDSFAKLQTQNNQSNPEAASAPPPSLSFGTPEENPNWQRIYLKNNPELSELISNPSFHLHLELSDGNNDGIPMTHEQFFSNTTQFAIIKYAIEQNQLQLDLPEQNYLTLKRIDAHSVGANQICWDASGNKHYLQPNQWFSEHNHGGQSCEEGLEKTLIESLNRSPLKETIELLKNPINNQNNPIEITSRIQPGADQPVTQQGTTQKPNTQRPVIKSPIPQGSLQVVSVQTINKMKDILQSSDDPYLQDIAKFQRWQDFKTVLDLQPAPISELMTPDGKPFATLVIDAKCPPLLLEEMIRRDLPLDTRMTSYPLTTRDYILKTCPDITTRELLDRYQSHNNINYDTPAFNPAIEEERLQTLKNLKQLEANLITSKSDALIETLAYQSGEGAIQGFISFFTAEITQYLEKRFSGNSLLRFWLPQITSAMIQSAVSLMLYPILKNTFWQDEEESQDSRKMLEALSVYFFSVLATGIAVNMAITKTKHFIEKKYGSTARTSKVLNFILPYLATLANLPSLLLSQSTYTNQAIAFGGFFVNLAFRGTIFNSLKCLREKCCPSSHSTPDDAAEMQTLNPNPIYENTKYPIISSPAEISPLFAAQKNTQSFPNHPEQSLTYENITPDKPTQIIGSYNNNKNSLFSNPIRKGQMQASPFSFKRTINTGTSSTQLFTSPPNELTEAFAKRANKPNNIKFPKVN
jgi:glutaredoxin